MLDGPHGAHVPAVRHWTAARAAAGRVERRSCDTRKDISIGSALLYMRLRPLGGSLCLPALGRGAGAKRGTVKGGLMPPCPASERGAPLVDEDERPPRRRHTIKMVVVLFGISTFSWLTPRATRPLPSYAAP